LEQVAEYVLRLQRWERAHGTLQGRLEERDRHGKWQERRIPALATIWAESGWSK
jgi:hypothetical protein